MNRILFLDPDPMIVAALRRLMTQLPNWNPAFATSSSQATHALASTRFDVVLSGLRLGPTESLDGIALLERVRQQFPGVIRVLSSELLDGPMLDRAIDVSHRFLARPFQLDDLKLMLEGLESATRRGHHPLLRTLVGRIGSLPTSPGVMARLHALLDDADRTSVHEVASVVATDSALTVKLLQIVNSAWFGMPMRTASVVQAISLLGLTPLRALLLMSQMMSNVTGGIVVPGFSADALQKRSLLTARLARALVDDPVDRETAFTAGLLHDIGTLVLAVGMKNRYALALRHAERSNRTLTDVETSFVGVSHDRVGAYLAQLWGLPEPLVEAIGRHHDAPVAGARAVPLVRAVQVAQRIAHKADLGPGMSLAEEGLDPEESIRLGAELENMGLQGGTQVLMV